MLHKTKSPLESVVPEYRRSFWEIESMCFSHEGEGVADDFLDFVSITEVLGIGWSVVSVIEKER